MLQMKEDCCERLGVKSFIIPPNQGPFTEQRELYDDSLAVKDYQILFSVMLRPLAHTNRLEVSIALMSIDCKWDDVKQKCVCVTLEALLA